VDEQAFGTISGGTGGSNVRLPLHIEEKTTVRKRRNITLMPVIALATLSLMVAVPALSSNRLYAASAQRYVTITVHPGDTLWSIAAAHTGDSSDVQESIDRITAVNHLHSPALQPGQHLRIPE
jgi:nucleoid-associated protein YgaU